MLCCDVVVVGGGVAGMTSAVLLAAAGRSVTLVEAHPRLAPTIQGFRRCGRHFDTGLHFVGGLGQGDPLHVYMTHLGLMQSLTAIPFDPRGYDALQFEETGELFAVPYGREALVETFTDWFPDEHAAINDYFGAVERVFDSSPYLNFTRPFTMESFLHGDAGTLSAHLDGLTKNERLKTLWKYPCMFYGVPPEEALFTTHALVAGSYYRSAHTFDGGGAALVRAYKARLKALGVEVVCGSAIRELRVSGGSFTSAVLEDGREIAAQSCVWSAHPTAMVNAAPVEAFRMPYRQRVASLEPTASALMIFLEAHTPVAELVGRNLVFWPGGDFGDMMAGRVSQRNSIMFLFAGQGSTEANRAVTALIPQDPHAFDAWNDSWTGRRPETYARAKRQLLEDFFEQFEQRCPGIASKLSPVEGATPLTLRDWCSAPQGALYGAKHSVNQINPQPITRIRGLMLCGQSIVAPGILGAVVSAYLTCGFILGHEELHRQLQEVA